MTSLVDYSQCIICKIYIYKTHFHKHFKECIQKNPEKYRNLVESSKNNQPVRRTTTQPSRHPPKKEPVSHSQRYDLVPSNMSMVSLNDNTVNHFLKKYDELFEQYVKGKCIALVGPAESILGTKKGEIIDKFDLVVRLNKSIPLPKDLSEDIGTRTDIVYNSMNTSDFPGENRLNTKLYKKYGVQFVASSYPYNHSIFKNDIFQYIQQYKFDIPFKAMDDTKFRNLENHLGTRPYTGTCAIYDLLSYPIQYLYITGLDFYHSKYYKEYRVMTKGQQKYTRSNTIHQAKPQLNYVKHLSLIDNRIILDSFLDNLCYQEYYQFYLNIKKIHPIYDFSDPMLHKIFDLKKLNCTFTKQSIHSTPFENHEPTIIFTTHSGFQCRNGEYAIYITENKMELTVLNTNMSQKRFIGNFYYVEHRSRESPSIFFNRNFLNQMKIYLRGVDIQNANVYLLLILSIMIYFPEEHCFSYREVIEQLGLTQNEKKLILFLYKKNKLNMKKR